LDDAMPTNGPPSGEGLETLERQVVDHFFELYPNWAVSLGLHEYDGRLPLVARAATDRWLGGAEALLHRLAAGETGRSEARHIDCFLLQLLLEGPRFDLTDVGEFERNPMVYLGSLSLTSYIARDYAPIAQRVDGILQILDAVPQYLAEARRRLGSKLPRPFLQLALSMGSGLPAHFLEAEEFARKADPEFGKQVGTARAGAETAIASFLRHLKDDLLPHATEQFALGPQRFQRLLFVREGLETPFGEIEKAGWADLKRNQARLAEIAAAEHTGADALFEKLRQDHPAADELIPTAQAEVEFTRRFVQEHHLVSIPDPANCRVEETPAWGRALSTASMDSPGPFDTSSGQGIYYVTPVDAKWSVGEQEEWLRSLNRTMLRNITVHEVFPGHFLQFLHLRQSPGTLSRKVYMSPSFVEGWAHYCEQLVIEQGMGGRGVVDEVAQIHDALLRDCRLIASIGLHTRGMSVAEATRLFETEAHFEHLPAEREAIRGTFNPEYFCYTLGKLAILQARTKYLDGRFGGSLQRFHDALLGFGCPPIGLFDRLLIPT
jgi:hypothetical protein